ncbi:hypothetical protein EGX98_11045 [Fusobacterium necrophorum]|uniref:Conjugal transfer protein n=2 Tax=Fusobacterium necrophorum TaxID=859 RepID=A0AB73BTF2_9FUSO|nr:VirB3 family type IV secretion system protein [Fusobacterium necrophorum]AYZ74516.1 hypothetical protein EGX98_11045 [Fusobacterium necrophorum]AZW09601.1 hypothetical protein EO219_08535 [Fusobacterium necrophorum subsp. necrophorum]KDE60978.1 hypothetical protein FUSO3_11495 [Fusobacterium necrophorum BL]KDE63648.1 hypothetical protein FUSO4_08985 [Fusobacterium necrophorum DJ-1]KDE64330.1 hypothetical protein FUSO5_06535 [Fusobacterium necrophorum BFTR-1]
MNEIKEIKDFKQMRVCKNLIKPETFNGVDIVGFVTNIMLGLFFTIVCKIYYLGIFFLIVHFVLRKICKKDGRIISIFLQSYVKEKKIYYKG